MINIGYACLAVAVPGSGMKNCTLKNATPDHLLRLIGENLEALDRLITYNARNGIRLFRISSDLVPFGSSLAADLPWREHYREKLSAIGKKIRDAGMRVSMHPGQYTVLNSPDEGVVERSRADLAYHAAVLDALGTGPDSKIILHLGGVYGDKSLAIQRFLERYRALDPAIRRRLVIENDDRLFNIEDIRAAAGQGRIPIVYDNLHNGVNPARPGVSDSDWITRCAVSWANGDGPQKIHYSQQNPGKRIGAHSDSIATDEFLDFYASVAHLDLDIMLEVKDKNLSALKCLNLTQDRGMKGLEEEWARYKYAILEHSPASYQAIRTLLKDKSGRPVREFYHLVEAALAQPIVTGQAVNAAQHVWGYFKDQATAAEKKRFEKLVSLVTAGEGDLRSVKSHLRRLALRYGETYLLESYYFDL